MTLPIVGQPRIGDFALSFIVHCSCGGVPVLCTGRVMNPVGTCSCGRVFVFRSATLTPENTVDIKLGFIDPPKV